MSPATTARLLTHQTCAARPTTPGVIDVTDHTRPDAAQLQAARDFVARLNATRTAPPATATTLPENAPQ